MGSLGRWCEIILLEDRLYLLVCFLGFSFVFNFILLSNASKNSPQKLAAKTRRKRKCGGSTYTVDVNNPPKIENVSFRGYYKTTLSKEGLYIPWSDSSREVISDGKTNWYKKMSRNEISKKAQRWCETQYRMKTRTAPTYYIKIRIFFYTICQPKSLFVQVGTTFDDNSDFLNATIHQMVSEEISRNPIIVWKAIQTIRSDIINSVRYIEGSNYIPVQRNYKIGIDSDAMVFLINSSQDVQEYMNNFNTQNIPPTYDTLNRYTIYRFPYVCDYFKDTDKNFNYKTPLQYDRGYINIPTISLDFSYSKKQYSFSVLGHGPKLKVTFTPSLPTPLNGEQARVILGLLADVRLKDNMIVQSPQRVAGVDVTTSDDDLHDKQQFEFILNELLEKSPTYIEIYTFENENRKYSLKYLLKHPLGNNATNVYNKRTNSGFGHIKLCWPTVKDSPVEIAYMVHIKINGPQDRQMEVTFKHSNFYNKHMDNVTASTILKLLAHLRHLHNSELR